MNTPAGTGRAELEKPDVLSGTPCALPRYTHSKTAGACVVDMAPGENGFPAHR